MVCDQLNPKATSSFRHSYVVVSLTTAEKARGYMYFHEERYIVLLKAP